jgi:hypothetical protein
MTKATAGKARVQRAPKRDIAGPAYRRVERCAMRPDDSLFVLAAVLSFALFAWFLTVL